MRPFLRTALAVVMSVALCASVAAVPAASEPTRRGCTSPFSAAFRAELADRYPNQRVTAAVYDTRTGCWFHLNRDLQITTASVIKAQFLAGVLLRAQDQGRGLSDWERARVAAMITFSHNPPASDLFVNLGGVSGMDGLDARFGLSSTTHSSTWGLTSTTATDRTKLSLALLHGGGPLGSARRSAAWNAMSSVHPTQQWGISAGVPRGWSVALKNGFYPAAGTPRWRIGSTGFVRHDASGQGYAITIMTDRNPDHANGLRLVEMVSRRVSSVLAGAPAAPRDVERSICVRAGAGESWGSVAARLGTSDVSGVQRVSGGTSNPIAGMRACNPRLAVTYDSTGPTADFVRAAYRTFLRRSPSSSETRAQTVAIDSGTKSRHDLTRDLSRSLEWISITIDALYRSALGRPAEDAGLRYWRDRVVHGLRITDVGAYMYASAEFYRRSGGTNRRFIDALYREILGRSPDDGGQQHWLGVLRAGHARMVVTRSFYASSESRRDRVTRVYRQVLGRSPDPGGHAYWADILLREDDVALAAFLAASEEYFRRAQR